jgi:fumarylacetoacetase
MAASTWIPIPPGSDFPAENLPFGVVRLPEQAARVVVRVGDHVLDLAAAGIAPELTERSSLNALMASGRGAELRMRAAELLAGRERPELLHEVARVEVVAPVEVRDFVDFSASLHHATNLGRIMRPEGEPLLPNWRHLPVGYHGRAGSIVVGGTDVVRPHGLVPGPDGVPRLVPTGALDLELEVGFFVGGPGATRVAPDDAGKYIFGAVLVNDWSARDIQSFEYRPLGPHLAKSFATTVSPWVVTLDALRPFLVDPPLQDPEPDPYLRASLPWALDLHLEVDLNGTTITATNFAGMYWTFAQQLAHVTVNGAIAGTGDLLASGTVSGPTAGERGSLVEITWNGRDPVHLADGTMRTFLDDGDRVVLRGWCGDDAPGSPRVGFGEAAGTIAPAAGRAGPATAVAAAIGTGR